MSKIEVKITHRFQASAEHVYDAWLDPVKARHWMRLVNRLVEHAVTRNCQAATRQGKPSLDEFGNWLLTTGMRSHSGIYSKVRPELRETAKFLRKRFKHFAASSGGDSSANEEGEDD